MRSPKFWTYFYKFFIFKQVNKSNTFQIYTLCRIVLNIQFIRLKILRWWSTTQSKYTHTSLTWCVFPGVFPPLCVLVFLTGGHQVFGYAQYREFRAFQCNVVFHSPTVLKSGKFFLTIRKHQSPSYQL